MPKHFNPKYLSDCIEHALERCQQVTPIRGDVIRLIREAFVHSHETATAICRDLRKQHNQKVSRLGGLESWERLLLAAAEGLLMPQPAMKMTCVLPECRLALDELATHFYPTYQSALSERDNADWRYNDSWICQERDWQQQHVSRVPPYLEVG